MAKKPTDLEGRQPPTQQTIQVSRRQSLVISSPLPPPELLKAYDTVVPGAAKQIVDNMLEESNHRRRRERFVAQVLPMTGQLFAAALSLGCIVVAAYAFKLGYPKSATTVMCTGIATVTGAFIVRRRLARAKQQQKMAQRPPQEELPPADSSEIAD